MGLRHEINITSRWGKLFMVKCLHDFYNNGMTSDLTFIPTEETQLLMRNLRLLFRPQKAGFIILYDSNNSHNLFKTRQVEKLEKLTFLIKNNNDLLLNFSNISFGNMNKIYYLSNSFSNFEEDELNLIHPTPYIENPLGIDLIPKSRQLQLTFQKEINSKDLKLLDWKGNAVNISAILQKDLPKKLDGISIPLRYLKQGKYVLSAKGIQEKSFYVTDNIDEFYWGIMDIYLKDEEGKGQIYSEEAFLKPNYHIRFQARSTFWKYILISPNKKNGEYKDAKVTLNGKTIPFLKPKDIVLNNGTKAYSIESKSPMKLQQLMTSSNKLELKLKKGNKWVARTVKLPKPVPKSIKPDKVSGKIYSTTYIYV